MKFATLYLLPVNMTGLLTSCSDFITQGLNLYEESWVIITVRIQKEGCDRKSMSYGFPCQDLRKKTDCVLGISTESLYFSR